jgi:hypothetical protein
MKNFTPNLKLVSSLKNNLVFLVGGRMKMSVSCHQQPKPVSEFICFWQAYGMLWYEAAGNLSRKSKKENDVISLLSINKIIEQASNDEFSSLPPTTILPRQSVKTIREQAFSGYSLLASISI